MFPTARRGSAGRGLLEEIIGVFGVVVDGE